MKKYNPEEISKIRHVMPTVIANNIVGCSPMKGPTKALLEMRKKQSD